MSATPELWQMAMDFGREGFRVHPLQVRGKTPTWREWQDRATCDPDTLDEAWTKTPNANIGLATGRDSGFFVVDVDGEKGEASLRSLEFELGVVLPETRKIETGGGGFHLYFRYPEGVEVRNKQNFRPGLDIRGEGGYVVAAGSVHPSKRNYKVVTQGPILDAPDKLLEHLVGKRRKTPQLPKRPMSLQSHASGNGSVILQRASRYLRECDAAVQGAGGHDALLWAARAMVIGFLLTDEEALGLLWNEFNPRCSPPWEYSSYQERVDFERKIQQARSTPGQKHPGWLLDEYGLRDRDALLEQGERAALSLLKPKKPSAPVNTDVSSTLLEQIVDAATYVKKAPPPVDPILTGVFERGDKVAVLAAAKSRKTFFKLQMAVSLATGREFLGLEVPKKVRVLFVNLEIKPGAFHRRVSNMAIALGVEASSLAGQLLVLNARGMGYSGAALIFEIEQALQSFHEQGSPVDVVVIDPLYKVADGDENKASDMKPILAAFDRLTAVSGAAVLYSHHDAKGSPGDRDIRDRGAGSGVLGRDYDAAMTLTPHSSDDDATVLEFLCRNFISPDPKTIRFDAGAFSVDQKLEPDAKTSSGGKSKPSQEQNMQLAREIFNEQHVWTKGDLQNTLATRMRMGIAWVRKNIWPALTECRSFHESRAMRGRVPVNLCGNDPDSLEAEKLRIEKEYEEARQRKLAI